jgi:His/Glu/Gln/Arg/opine family amino acid ABC transporter permease subunit
LPSFSHFLHTLITSKNLFIDAPLLTLKITVVSILIGIILGLFFALLTISRIKVLEYISNAYVFLIRGTPLIVQIFILYFGFSGISSFLTFGQRHLRSPSITVPILRKFSGERFSPLIKDKWKRHAHSA